jgi:protein-S-isoprenylcysteine O-methyltransferase Ste14
MELAVLVSVLLVAGGFALWALLHSLSASVASKEQARRYFGPGADRWYRLAYNTFSVVSILPLLILLAALPDRQLYLIPVPWSWPLRAVQLMALVGLIVAFLQTDPKHFAGLSQLAGTAEAGGGRLVVRGFYCRVRHPLYFFSILLVWSTSQMTVLWLEACILITLYFYLGSLHEEKRLLAEFGQAYAQYQQRVPMLVPRPGRCVMPTPEE